MVLRARPGTIDRARARFGPPLSARTWELSIPARARPPPASLPVPQPPPARHPRPEPQLLGQELPRDPRVQDKQDAGQDLAVIQPPTAGMIRPGRDGRTARRGAGP